MSVAEGVKRKKRNEMNKSNGTNNSASNSAMPPPSSKRSLAAAAATSNSGADQPAANSHSSNTSSAEDQESRTVIDLDPFVRNRASARYLLPFGSTPPGKKFKANAEDEAARGEVKPPVARLAARRRPRYMYGQRVPDPPPPNVCAGCRQDSGGGGAPVGPTTTAAAATMESPIGTHTTALEDEQAEDGADNNAHPLTTTAAVHTIVLNDEEDVEEEEPVLLCDGPNCGREYHLRCCVPPLTQVPEGDWYCPDCTREGTTLDLKRYFQQNDLARSLYASPFLYRVALRQADWQTPMPSMSPPSSPPSVFPDATGLHPWVAVGSSALPVAATTTTTRSKPTKTPYQDKVVTSELQRIERIHFAALSNPEQQSHQMMMMMMMPPSGPGGTRRPMVLGPGFLVGKPVRLYEPTTGQYHTGRIVDMKDGDFETEYLVRFPAGTEGRKKALYHWMILEEHDLSVGTTLVWACVQSEWQPCLLWLRTSRSIILQERSGAGGGLDDDDHNEYRRPLYHSSSSTSSRREKVMAWVKPFDSHLDYEWIDVKTNAVDYMAPRSYYEMYCTTEKLKLLSWAAMAEWQEQHKVQRWKNSYRLEQPLLNPKALSGLDLEHLEPLLPVKAKHKWYEQFPNAPGTAKTATGDGDDDDNDDESFSSSLPQPTHAQLCPLIPQGMDRLHLMDLLSRQGVRPTKDVGATLSCQMVSLSDCHTLGTKRPGTGPTSTTKGSDRSYPKRMRMMGDQRA